MIQRLVVETSSFSYPSLAEEVRRLPHVRLQEMLRETKGSQGVRRRVPAMLREAADRRLRE